MLEKKIFFVHDVYIIITQHTNRDSEKKIARRFVSLTQNKSQKRGERI